MDAYIPPLPSMSLCVAYHDVQRVIMVLSCGCNKENVTQAEPVQLYELASVKRSNGVAMGIGSMGTTHCPAGKNKGMVKV